MDSSQAVPTDLQDRQRLNHLARPLTYTAVGAGAAGLVLAVILSLVTEDGVRRFGFAYLTSFAYFLSLSLGGLFFVMITHLFRAGWSVTVRRPAEILAANFPTLVILSLPILLIIALGDGTLYPWAVSAEHLLESDPEHAVPATGKETYLSITFFFLRFAVYLLVWSAMGTWYLRQSTRQDIRRDIVLTRKMEKFSAPGMLIFAFTITFASFDLIMSLDPAWYSTVFGVYYFSGGFMGGVAIMILMIYGLQKLSLLQAVSIERYHDLGKLLFAFVFFWGYIAFSQYLLIWYANLPDTTYWFAIRGVTTNSSSPHYLSGWTWISLLLLSGHLLIPFAGLLSRHVKRNKKLLACWSAWLLVMHWVDMYWLIMPEYRNPEVVIGLMELSCFVGIGGLYMAGAVKSAAGCNLIPINDPRLHESLAVQNI